MSRDARDVSQGRACVVHFGMKRCVQLREQGSLLLDDFFLLATAVSLYASVGCTL